MQYDAGSLLYKLQYLADYEELLLKMSHPMEPKSHQLPILYCGATPMGNPKMQQKTLKSINPEQKQLFFLNGSPSIPSLPTYNSKFPTPICHIQHLELISQWTNVVGTIFKTTRRTRNWTQNSKYRMKELKATIAETFLPPRPLKPQPPEPQSAGSTVQAQTFLALHN